MIFFLALRDSGFTSRKGRKENRIKGELNHFNTQLLDLEKLYDEGLLDKDEYIKKSLKVKKLQIKYIKTQRVYKSEDYDKVIKAYEKGYITDKEKSKKIKKIRKSI